jgi:hypothetical protein
MIKLDQVPRKHRRWLDWVLSVTAFTSAGRSRIHRRIYRLNRSDGIASASGRGSDLSQTAMVRSELPALLKRHHIRSLVDAPCGDLFWLRQVEDLGLEQYIGIDIVPELIETLSSAPPIPNAEFLRLDIVSDRLPKADAILCRDLLVHLNYRQINRCLQNFLASGSTYVLLTTFLRTTNADSVNGRWRPLNLQDKPFGFPEPLEIIVEGNTERNVKQGGSYDDKSLALWRLADLHI